MLIFLGEKLVGANFYAVCNYGFNHAHTTKAKAHLLLFSLIFMKGRHNMSTYLGQHFMWMWHRDVLMLWMVIQILERFHSFLRIGYSPESSTENSSTYKKLSALAGKWHLSRSHCVFSVVYSCVHIVYSVLCIVYCSGKEVEAVPPHPALVAGSTL